MAKEELEYLCAWVSLASYSGRVGEVAREELAANGFVMAPLREENKKAVGSRGFSMEGAIEEKDKVADFGLIKGISAVFLNEDNIEAQINKIYVPLPKDASHESSSGYSSFISDSKEMVETIKGKKLIPDYNAKKGIKKGFISIDKGIKADARVAGRI